MSLGFEPSANSSRLIARLSNAVSSMRLGGAARVAARAPPGTWWFGGSRMSHSASAHDAGDPRAPLQVLGVRARLAAGHVEGHACAGEDFPRQARLGAGGSGPGPSLRLPSCCRARGSWSTANAAILAEGTRRLIDDPHRFDGVTTIGVDNSPHAALTTGGSGIWRHARKGDKYGTGVIDLTPTWDRTGPVRLLDMLEGRSKAVFKQWLAARPKPWRDGIDVVAMDGFTGSRPPPRKSSLPQPR